MSALRIGIVGAGFAGLSAAKVLKRFGHDVTVFEKTPDVGGVWSRHRRYPGLRTQNNKSTYCFSDFPMPRDYPEWPTGPQVQAYLAAYVEHFGLWEHLRLNAEVVAAELDEAATRWEVTTDDTRTGERSTAAFDWLVVANGIFCDPLVPDYEGVDEHRAAGGRVCHTSDFHELDEARGRHVVIVGYGKSSCDVAAEISDVAASTTVVARGLLWKMPKRLGNALNYKYVMLTRMGEGLFRYIRPRGFERFLHGRGQPVRRFMLGGVQSVATWQLGLRELGLVPRGSFEDIARSTVSLATDGFYEKVRRGEIAVHRDTVITRLLVDEGRPAARLSDGTQVPADVVVCGTGFRQRVPFLSEDIQRQLTDGRGNFELYRQIHPLDVPRLSFSGYNSSFFSPLSAEIAALWIANLFMGGLTLPPVEEMRAHVDARLRWMEARTQGRHARGTNVIPFSMHNVDETLEDIGIDVGPATRFAQWLLPVDPEDYRKVTDGLLERRARLEWHGREPAGLTAA
jgi:dimethylaniline monooxygenase (N-oxide forming)